MTASNNTKNILFLAEKINFKAQRKFILSFISPILSSFFDMYSVVRNDKYFGRVLKQYVQTICPQFSPSSGEFLFKDIPHIAIALHYCA